MGRGRRVRDRQAAQLPGGRARQVGAQPATDTGLQDAGERERRHDDRAVGGGAAGRRQAAAGAALAHGPRALRARLARRQVRLCAKRSLSPPGRIGTCLAAGRTERGIRRALSTLLHVILQPTRHPGTLQQHTCVCVCMSAATYNLLHMIPRPCPAVLACVGTCALHRQIAPSACGRSSTSEARQPSLCCAAGSFPVPGSRGNRALHCSGTWLVDWEAVPYPTHVQVTLTAYRTPAAVLAVLHMRASCRGQPAHVLRLQAQPMTLPHGLCTTSKQFMQLSV